MRRLDPPGVRGRFLGQRGDQGGRAMRTGATIQQCHRPRQPLTQLRLSPLGHRRQVERAEPTNQRPKGREDEDQTSDGQPPSPDRPARGLRQDPDEVDPHANHDTQDQGQRGGTQALEEKRRAEPQGELSQHSADRAGQRRVRGTGRDRAFAHRGHLLRPDRNRHQRQQCRRRTYPAYACPQSLAIVVRIGGLIGDNLQTDPTFQTTGLYRRLSASEVRKQLIARKGYTDERLPSVQTIGDKLNLLGFRLRTVIKSRPPKK